MAAGPGAMESPNWCGQLESRTRLAFSCIHVISPQIFTKMTESGAFSIIDAYLHLAAQGEKIVSFLADGSYWRDLGRPEAVSQAAQDLENGEFSAD